MAQYVSVPIETDPDSIAQEAFDYLSDVNPGWVPHDGQLDTWLIEAVAQAAAIVRDTASDVPISIFRYFGASVIGLAPIDAVAATTSTNWTLSDNLGHTIPAGTVIGVPDGFGNYIPFEVVTDTVVAPGGTTALNVPIEALETGSEATGLGTTGTACTLLDQLAWVSNVVLTNTTVGGTDAEDDSVYLDRLASFLRLMAPRPILPADFAALALTIAGVGRAATYDGYDAVLLTTGNARTISLAVVSESGTVVSAGVKSQVQAYLASLREVNFNVYVLDPTFNTVDVTYSALVYTGYDPAEVKTRIDAAIQSFLSPATWGSRNTGDETVWDNRTVVKLNDLIVAIGRVDGVDDVVSVTQRISPAAYAAADVNLTGVFPLPVAGTLIGTVT